MVSITGKPMRQGNSHWFRIPKALIDCKVINLEEEYEVIVVPKNRTLTGAGAAPSTPNASGRIWAGSDSLILEPFYSDEDAAVREYVTGSRRVHPEGFISEAIVH